MRPSFALLISVVLLIVCAPFNPTSAQTSKGARLSYPKDGWNFGSVIQGEKRQKKLVLKNTGDQALVIRMAKVTCGCLAVKAPKAPIPAGGSAELVIDLDSLRQFGTIKKHVIVATNSRSEAQVFIPVIGEIKPVYRLERSSLDLGSLNAGQSASASMKIYALPGVVPKVRAVPLQSEAVTIGLELFGEPDGEHGLIVTAQFNGKGRPGRLMVPVRIELAEDRIDAIRFTVVGEILGDLRLQPSTLTLPDIKRSKGHRFQLTLASHGKKPFLIEKANCHDQRITLSAPSAKPATTQTVTVTIKPKGPAGVLRTRIYLVTNRPNQRVITVPLSARIVD